MSIPRFPYSLLPGTHACESPAGKTQTTWHCIPKGIPIYGCFGDLQAAFFSHLTNNVASMTNPVEEHFI